MLARSESRDGYAVRVLAVHTSEGNDQPDIDDAASLRDASWWTGSSHAIADDDPGSLLTPAEGCVPYDRASWTLRSGNRWSENIELIGWARWTRAEWLARPTLLDRCAYWLADRSKARGIPLVKLTPAEYRAGGRGVIGHHDHTVGYSDGTHWDPGPGFPWDVVLDKARAYAAGKTAPAQEDDDMPLFIAAPGRGHALVWPGFIKRLPGGSGAYQEELDAAIAEFGPFETVSTRLFDLRVSLRMNVEMSPQAINGILDAPIERNEKAGGGTTTLRTQAHWDDYNFRTVTPEAVAKVVGTPDVDALAVKLGEALQGRTSITREDVKSAVQEALREGTGDPATGPVA